MQDIEIFIGANPGDYQRVLKEIEADRKRLAETERRIAKDSADAVERIRRDYAEREKKMAQEVAAIRIAEEKRAEAAIQREQQRATAQREREEKASLERRRQAMQELGQAVTIAFAGLALTLGAAVKEFSDFEASLNQIKAVSGATTEQMDRLKMAAQKLGADTKFSAKEAADGMGELAKAGFTVEQTLAAIPGVMSLAAAGGVSVAQAAEAAGAALNGFGLGADEAQRVADLLAKTANVSAVGIGDLQNSFKYIAPIAASTSQSIEEVATVLAVLGNAGIKGEQGGTVVRASLVALAKPSDDAADKLHALGISIQDTHGKMLPLSDIIGQLRDKTSGLTEVQRANAVATIFGSEAMSGILALMKQTPAQFDAAAKSVRDYNGASKEMADTMNGGIKGAFEQLGGSVSTLAIQIGEQLAPAVKALAQGAQGLVDGFNSLPAPMQSLIAGTGAAAVAFTGLVAIVGAVTAALPLVSAGLATLGVSIGAVLGPIGLLSAALGAAVVGYKLISDAQREAAVGSHKTADGARREAEQISDLVAEYDTLKAKTNLTAKEKERLRVVLDQIEKIAPGVIAGYDGQGKAADISKDAVARYNTQLERQIQLLNKAAEAAHQKALADRDGARMAMYATEQEIKSLEKQLEKQQSATPTRSYDPTGRSAAVESNAVGLIREQIKNARERLANQAKMLREATAAFDREYGIKMGAASASPVTTRGSVVAPAERKGRKGKDPAKEAERVAREAEQAASARVSKIQELREYEARLAQAGGLETSVATMAKLRTVINDIKAEKLDKTASGTEAITTAQRELNVMLKQEETNRDALNKRIIEEMNSYSQGFNEKQAHQESARLQAAEADAQKFRTAIQGIQGDFAGLAVDPSLERIGNFVRDFTKDSSKLGLITGGFKRIGDAMAKAKEEGGDFGKVIQAGSDAATEAIKGIAAAIDVTSLGVLALIKVAEGLGEAFEKAYAASEKLAGQRASLALQNEEAAANAIQDPTQRAEALKTVRRKQLEEEFRQKLIDANKTQDDAQFGIRKNLGAALTSGALNVLGGPGSLLGGLFGKQASEMILDQSGFWEQGLEAFPELKKAYENQLKAINDTTEAADESRKSQILSAEEHTKTLEDAITKQQALMESGRNNRGEKISLYDERGIKLAEQATANAEKLKSIDEQRKKLTEERIKSERDEADRIRDIENEGIAQRARTEYQDKAIRIAAIQEEGVEKRKQIDEQIGQLDEQRAKEQQMGEEAIARIKAQYAERIGALEGERQKLLTLLGIDRQRLEVYRQMAALTGVSTAASSSVQGSYTSTGGGSSGSKYSLGGAGGFFTAATGGMVAGGVPGVDSVPILAQQGELIVDNATTAALQGFLRNAQEGRGYPTIPASAMRLPPGGGGVTVQVVVNPSPGMDERALAQMVQRQIGDTIRRSVGRVY